MGSKSLVKMRAGAAQELLVFFSQTFGRFGRTMLGVSLERIARLIRNLACHNNVSGPCEFTKTLSRLRERGREFSKESKHTCKLYCFIHHKSFHLPRRATRETRKREATKVAIPRSCDDNATHRAVPWSFPWWLVGLREFPHGEHRLDSLFHCLSPFTFDRQIGRFSRNSHFPTCTPACVPNAHVTYSTHSHISSR